MTDSALNFTHLSIVSIPVSDQEKSKRFYAEQLGFQVIRDDHMGPDRRWIQLRPSGARTSIVLVTWFPGMSPGSVDGLVLETADVDTDHDALRGRGVELSELSDAPWGRFATFEDPDGNGWVLQQTA